MLQSYVRVAGPMGLRVYKGGDHVSGLLPYLAILVGCVRSRRLPTGLQGCSVSLSDPEKGEDTGVFVTPLKSLRIPN